MDIVVGGGGGGAAAAAAVVTLEIWCEGSSVHSIRSPVVNEEREAMPLVRVNALCSFRYFNIDGWLTGRTFIP